MRTDARPRRAGAGVYVVEFAIVLLAFLSFVFGVIEMARWVYLSNTLPVVMQRAVRGAAMTDFSKPGALAALRRYAVFGGASAMLPLGDPIGGAHVRIDYLAANLQPVTTMPACPAENLSNCLNNPTAGNCIRFVRARLCQPDTDCSAVAYQPLVPLISLNANWPSFATVARAESLGYQSQAGCP